MSVGELAASYFDPIAARHGLIRTSLRRQNVEYRRDAVALAVSFSDRDSEFMVVIKRDVKGGAPERLDLSEVLHWRGVTPSIGNFAHAEANQRIVLQELARLTDENARDLLAGDVRAFASAFAHQRQMRDASSLVWTQEDARKRADRAWRAKDYAGVIAALAPIEEHLSAAERARLQYCRKHRRA